MTGENNHREQQKGAKGMKGTPPEWDKVAQERLNEVCRALVRMGPMTFAQLGRLLGLKTQSHHGVLKQLIKHGWQSVIAVPYKSIYRSRRYPTGKAMKFIVRLTEQGTEEWSRREGTRGGTYVKPANIGRMLNVADMFVRLRTRGVLYDKWDMTRPQLSEGLHAIFKRKQDGQTLGMYLLPLEFEKHEETKVKAIHQGILRKVTQNSGKHAAVFFLVPSENYAMTLDILVSRKFLPGFPIHLLPLDIFLKDPENYLNGILDGESQALIEVTPYLKITEMVEDLTTMSGFPLLARMADGGYRYIDTYTNGHLQRVQNWYEGLQFFAQELSNTGAVPRASVYVYEPVMLEGVRKVLSKKDDLLTDVYPWPSVLPRVNMTPLTETAADDWSIFDQAFEGDSD